MHIGVPRVLRTQLEFHVMFAKLAPSLGIAATLALSSAGGCVSDTEDGSAEQEAVDYADIQILSVSDWHGQLDPMAITNVGNVGGAAVLSAYFKRERDANPNTLVLAAGDSFGATPPLSNFFSDEPSVLAMNAMGFDADGLGNHNFDGGTKHLADLIDLADFPFLSANLKNVNYNVKCKSPAEDKCVPAYTIVKVGGVRVAIIGATNDDAAALVKPGNLGNIKVTAPAYAANNARAKAKADGAKLFIALVHMGATATDSNGKPTGPLMDFAKKLSGFDVVLGDHTNFQVNEVVNGALVVENQSFGRTYAKIKLNVKRSNGDVKSSSVEFVTPMSDQITADAALEQILKPYRDELAVAFDGKIGTADGLLERGNNVERLGEVAIGNLVADSMRLAYGTDLGFTNGGGVRAPLPSSYAPKDTTLRRPASGYAAGPPFDLVIGDVFAVLPFGNSVITRTVTGKQVWAVMEHSVEGLPEAKGWFGQISGFKVTYDSSKPAGQRVVSIDLEAGGAIPNSDTQTYTFATSDFIATGGDGYTMLADNDGTSRDKMADVLLSHIKTVGTLSSAKAGRLVDLAHP